MVRIVIGLVVCISLFVSGCASPAAGISPIFTASSNYADWECDQINLNSSHSAVRFLLLKHNKKRYIKVTKCMVGLVAYFYGQRGS